MVGYIRSNRNINSLARYIYIGITSDHLKRIIGSDQVGKTIKSFIIFDLIPRKIPKNPKNLPERGWVCQFFQC